MVNDVRRSSWPNLSVPVATGWMEVLSLEQRDQLLILTSKSSRKADLVRRYARHTVTFDGAATYMFLCEPPMGTDDPMMQPAIGTAVLLAVTCCVASKLALRASLMDCNAADDLLANKNLNQAQCDIGVQGTGLIFSAMQV
jgi:hypothetical protein